jgi:N-acetyl-anhydromuramyl-L-alanine amidase AmpD
VGRAAALALVGAAAAGALLFLAARADEQGPRVEHRPTEGDPPGPSPDVDRFVQAAHWAAGNGRRVDLVVLHTTENETAPGVAAAVAQMFAVGAQVVSAHYVVGPDEVIGCVDERDVAWAAPGANTQGVQIEMVGRARYTAEDWTREPQGRVLDKAVVLAASICSRHAVPAQVVDAAGLLRGERGITTHAAASIAFKKSDHWDPGPAFPLEDFIARVKVALAARGNA